MNQEQKDHKMFRNFLLTITDILHIIFNPRFMIMNEPYDKKLNEAIKLEMKKGTKFEPSFLCVDKNRPSVVKFGDLLLWTENYPYAVFSSVYYTYERESRNLHVNKNRPSRLTIYRLYKKFLVDSFSMAKDAREVSSSHEKFREYVLNTRMEKPLNTSEKSKELN